QFSARVSVNKWRRVEYVRKVYDQHGSVWAELAQRRSPQQEGKVLTFAGKSNFNGICFNSKARNIQVRRGTPRYTYRWPKTESQQFAFSEFERLPSRTVSVIGQISARSQITTPSVGLE